MTTFGNILTAIAVMAGTVTLTANAPVNVISVINNDSTSTIRVIQPAALDALTARTHQPVETPVPSHESEERENPEGADGTAAESGTPTVKVAGYRVQVFSDNNQRTAKGEARTKEVQVREAFPEYDTYIVYNSPFWRLKVGDFRTQHEAEAAADAIKSRFPSFAREIRVVKDRVNVRK